MATSRKITKVVVIVDFTSCLKSAPHNTVYNLLMEAFFVAFTCVFVCFNREQQFPGAVREAAEAGHVGQRRLHAVTNPPISGRRRRFKQLLSWTNSKVWL